MLIIAFVLLCLNEHNNFNNLSLMLKVFEQADALYLLCNYILMFYVTLCNNKHNVIMIYHSY
jgi:hypothetical protein